MVFTRSLTAGAALAGAALAYYVRRRHQRNGEGYLHIIKQLPADAQSWATHTRERAAQAIEDGRTAARHRDHEITQQLEAVTPASGVLV
jgi:hypothetical protein